MARNCYNCKYYDTDYEWDDDFDDEIIVEYCSKQHEQELTDDDCECPYFKKQKPPKPYVEEDGECDFCKYSAFCESQGFILECTARGDTRRHFIRGRGCHCQREEGAFTDKILSEMIELGDRANISTDYANFLKRAIAEYGDIKYGEFYGSGKAMELTQKIMNEYMEGKTNGAVNRR